MKNIVSFFLLLVILSPARADLPPGAVRDVRRGLHFDLMPKAFTKNPTIDMTVYSERTDYGRTLPEATPAQPIYYVSEDKGYKPMGAVPAEHPPMPAEVDRMLRRSLADQGFLAAEDRAHPPSLALFISWGSHSAFDREDAAKFPESAHQGVIERAMLVGGRGLAKKYDEEYSYGLGPIPFLSAKEDCIRRQFTNDIYYVVVSAYAFEDLAKGSRRLVWRTTMTVDASGVSIAETMPPLIASGAYYFGRDTNEAVALRRDVRRGSIKFGPLRIVEDSDPAARPAPGS